MVVEIRISSKGKHGRGASEIGKPREGRVNRSSEEMVSRRLPVVLGIKSKYG